MLLAMNISHNSLRTNPTHLDLVPEEPFRPPSIFSKQIFYLHETVQWGWNIMSKAIRRALPSIGMPMGRYVITGDPAVIELDDWGDVHLVMDRRGPRVITRICTPGLSADAVWYREIYLQESMNNVMYSIMKMGETAGRLLPSREMLLRPWPFRTTDQIKQLRLNRALAAIRQPGGPARRRRPNYFDLQALLMSNPMQTMPIACQVRAARG